MIVLTDRSRLDTYDRCPREAFWNYYWGGKGVVLEEEPLPFLFGTAVHHGLERLLVGRVSLPDAIAAGLPAFDGLSPFLKAEQSWLFDCLVRVWATHRLPTLRAEFDFLKIEPELLWTLGSEGPTTIVQMIRPDLLARRISDGALFYIEWKTTAYGGGDWARKWEKNAQVLCNAIAIEETLSERVEGVLIEGLVKGPRKVESRVRSRFNGQMLQQSHLCYCWDSPEGLSLTWTKNSIHTPLWEVAGMTPEVWLARLDASEFLCPVPPITPDRDDIADWRDAAKWKMLRIQEGLTRLASTPGEDKRKVVSRYFPQNFNACYPYGFGSRCGYFPMCFEGEVRKDPLSEGYLIRTPHHEAERCRDSEDSPRTT